ncbi:phosphatase PAP2 family protein [Auritidibacter ignavus]|uniref:phosphatase PAP2 family protein n=1 Tax=Auritidibacter ignavus TaxID=678932 RepID=UPI0024BA04E1|nr:phosphatase PAP2 family protein [Auritidibacter ignavus]WHS35483.1 phosphatase PAP2 family protein [Auritidibacter ignavus]
MNFRHRSSQHDPEQGPESEPISAEKQVPFDPKKTYNQYGETDIFQVDELHPNAASSPASPDRLSEPGLVSHVSDESAGSRRRERHPQHQPGHAPMAIQPASRLGLWALWALVMALALWGIYTFFVTSHTGQIIEQAAINSATQNLQSLHSYSQMVLSELPTVVAVLAVLTFVVITLFRRRWLASLIAVVVFAGANISTQVLKNVVLTRPDLANGVPYYTGNSMPSGHTTFAAAAVIAIFLVVAPRWRSLVAFLGAVFVSAVGVATFLEAWHRPADMVAALLVSGIWGLIGGAIIFRVEPQWNAFSARGRPRDLGWNALLWTLGIMVLLGAAATVAIATGLNMVPEQFNPESLASMWYLAYGALFIAGSCFVIYGVLSTFFRAETGQRGSR